MICHSEGLSSSEKTFFTTEENKRIAFFDFDGTLTPTNCIHYFVIIKFFYLGAVSRWLWLLRFIAQVPIYYLLDKYNAQLFNRYFFAKFSGMDSERVAEIIKSHVTPFLYSQVFSEAEREIQNRQQQGYDVVVVSGSWYEVVFPVVSALGVSECLATRLETKDGRFTGKADFAVDDGKEAMMRRYAISKGTSLQCAIAYGNSRWDISMLSCVERAFAVNPDKGLRCWAGNNNTECLSWRRLPLPRRAYWLGPLIMPFMRSIQGLEYIPKQGGALIIANHSSYLDHFCISTILACFFRRPARFVAKKEHFISPVSRWFHTTLGAYPIDRERGGKDALKKTTELLTRGEVVVIYPEGTRTLTGKMGPFLPGVLHIEKKVGCPIVPMGIKGAFDVWPKHQSLPRLGRVDIRFDAPVLIKELGHIPAVPAKAAREKKLNLLRERVACLIQ